MPAAIDAGESFRWQTPAELFKKPFGPVPGFLRNTVNYDVTHDGRLFSAALSNAARTAESPTLRMFVNWMSALPAR